MKFAGIELLPWRETEYFLWFRQLHSDGKTALYGMITIDMIDDQFKINFKNYFSFMNEIFGHLYKDCKIKCDDVEEVKQLVDRFLVRMENLETFV